MNATPLMRAALRPLYRAAKQAHSGLLLQRGLIEHREGDATAKTDHIDRICRSAIGGFYRRAYDRWTRATADTRRFRSVTLRLQTRLFIGLTGGGMLETGCVISHSHGAPCIPGSSVKGLVSAHARDRLGADGAAVCDELFGATASEERSAGLSGLITFHDAWWVPGPAAEHRADEAEREEGGHPLVQEIVTTHHPDYYGDDGRTPATDFDSPIPNAQIAVRGAFFFVIEGPARCMALAEPMLVDALTTRGAGAKTRAGYGVFEAPPAGASPGRAPGSAWVDQKIAEQSASPGVQPDQALRGKRLAEAWAALDDETLRQAVLADIRARWKARGWWDAPQGGAAKKAKALYDAGAVAESENR